MFDEDLEMTLECALNIRSHLTRILEREHIGALEKQLQYVNQIIRQISFEEEFRTVA